MKKKLILLCAVVVALVLFGASWKWTATGAKADDGPTVAQVVPLNDTGPSVTADVVSTDGSGSAALPNHPVVATVTTSDGEQYRAILIPSDDSAATPDVVVSVNSSWGW